jgi:hypothetical protein
MRKGSTRELSFDGRITGWTMQTGNRQFSTTNRAAGWCSIHEGSPEKQLIKAGKAYNQKLRSIFLIRAASGIANSESLLNI